ncbi:hypothetical protein [Desulforamulus reducens]|uniref:hypothetical protein n=1 Tax=Desulforamulus reducens TaxID=59610 RepID=UPI00059DEE48|nr:hypothetical protein [Desulforamulus reducens]
MILNILHASINCRAVCLKSRMSAVAAENHSPSVLGDRIGQASLVRESSQTAELTDTQKKNLGCP